MSKLLQQLSKQFNQYINIHNREVAPLLNEHHHDLYQIKEDIKALYELEEMNFYVMSRALLDNVFEDDREKAIDTLNQLQDEYLAVVALTNFFSWCGRHDPDDNSDESE